ncbi:MAG TPA: outer membrane lipid asymmetry maintenance protein MlaD [Candidatus Binataceae bacterium]|nr:outer membrane lipid asymmetry maintenance protein MlaD [Candidatus Binataceae bacterium]
MYASRTTQLIVGIFTVVGVLALVYLSVRLGKVDLFSTPGETLYANFNNISGLKTGDQVEIAGVTVGKVTGISLDQDRAHVTLGLHQGIEVDSDAIASVFTSGLIGDKYVAIALGGGDNLQNGGTIRYTQDAFQLETAIGKLIDNFGGGSSKSSSSGDSGSSASSAGPGSPGDLGGNPPGFQSKTNTTPSSGGNQTKENK